VKLTWWGSMRPLAALTVLGMLTWRVGAGPFLDGIRLAGGWPLVAGAALAVPITFSCAWRWTLVANGMGIALALPAAIAACYRSQFVNTALPGGVLGDLHRGARHGQEEGQLGRGLRAVMWERLAGQVVQVATTLVTLLLVPSPVRSSLPAVAVGVLGVGVVVGLILRVVPSGTVTRRSRMWRCVRGDLRDGLLRGQVWPAVTLASVGALAGHLTTFLVAARVAGVSASPLELLPLALLVLLAMAIPLNIGGWGPREGVAAWVFAAAGLGAARGVTTAVVYGVMVLVAGLPGAVVLLMSCLRHAESPVPLRTPLVASGGRVGHG
jgi:uncharacterized membrane protein YbhN (UPF0104 family)